MSFLAGTGVTDISPQKSMFLVGYPHVERMSTGVNDPLFASSLLLKSDKQSALFISLDILFLSPKTAKAIRDKIAKTFHLSSNCIFISCTHTHSGPVTCDMLAFKPDPVVPDDVDQEYMTFLEKQIMISVENAQNSLRKATFASTSVLVDGVGCNRIDPEGARDPEVTILAVKDAETDKVFGLTMTYCMHPTVMHEDSTLISSDFPGYARIHLQEKIDNDLVVVYQTGPEGNQSPRYHVKGQTFAEAERLGRILGESVYGAVANLADDDFCENVTLAGAIEEVAFERRRLPFVEDAKKNLDACLQTFEDLKTNNAGHGPVRTAECAVFGGEETLFLAQCQEDGRLDAFLEEYKTFEIQVVRTGDVYHVGWPGEIFIEFSLELKERADVKTSITCLVNGELQGYIVTEDAVKAGGYEATNAMFKPNAGKKMIETSLQLIQTMKNEE